ncbi:amino acid permease-domain-containing protein [Aspergillus oleicola]
MDTEKPLNDVEANTDVPDRNNGISADEAKTTKCGLKSRYAQMLALGGTIGTALFVGSGQTLARSGPAFILGCYCFMSLVVYTVATALTETAPFMPVPVSSASHYVSRIVSPSFGFAVRHSVSILALVIVELNSLPVHFYGESEFWFASLKVIMMAGLFFGDLLDGNTARFLALLSKLVLSALPFTFAPEFLILTTGKLANPRKTLLRAAKRYICRILFFYISSILAITVICPPSDATLTSGGTEADASPFVVGIKSAGILVLDSVINAGFLVFYGAYQVYNWRDK